MQNCIENWPFLKLCSSFKFSSLSTPTKIEELTAGSDKNTQRSPAGNRTQGLANSSRTLYPLSNEATTETVCEFSTFTKLSVLFPLWGDPDCPSQQARSEDDDENWLNLNPFNRKLALVGIIPNQILLSFSSDFSSDPAVSSSIFVRAEREENLIRNDPNKSEFTIERI